MTKMYITGGDAWYGTFGDGWPSAGIMAGSTPLAAISHRSMLSSYVSGANDQVGTTFTSSDAINLYDNVVDKIWTFSSAGISSQVTVSGTLSFMFYGIENDMMANVEPAYLVQKVDGTTGAITTVCDSPSGSELSSSWGIVTWTDTPTSTTFYPGDRIRVVPYYPAGMNSGYNAAFRFYTSSESSCPYVDFTETLSFIAAPTTKYTLYASAASAPVSVYGADKSVIRRKVYY